MLKECFLRLLVNNQYVLPTVIETIDLLLLLLGVELVYCRAAPEEGGKTAARDSCLSKLRRNYYDYLFGMLILVDH